MATPGSIIITKSDTTLNGKKELLNEKKRYLKSGVLLQVSSRSSGKTMFLKDLILVLLTRYLKNLVTMSILLKKENLLQIREQV